MKDASEEMEEGEEEDDGDEEEDEGFISETNNSSNTLQSARVEREKRLQEMMDDEDGRSDTDLSPLG